MSELSEQQFFSKLAEVIYKLSKIGSTQTYRFKQKWDELLAEFEPNPHLVRDISIDKEKFLIDNDYRIAVSKSVENAIVDGFYSIKSLLNTLYHAYFNSDKFITLFSEDDRIAIKYLTAKEILGNLIQYNQMDHDTVPLHYNIMGRNYLLIKLKGQSTSQLIENLKKLNIELSQEQLLSEMNKVVSDGLVNREEKDGEPFFTLTKELKLSAEGQQNYNEFLQALISWPTQFWRSFYNIREMNVTPNKDVPFRNFLVKVLSKSATQGFRSAHFVFKNLVKYFESTKQS